MSNEAETIARYRTHADTLRQISQEAKDVQMRLALMTFADDFERMADETSRARKVLSVGRG